MPCQDAQPHSNHGSSGQGSKVRLFIFKQMLDLTSKYNHFQQQNNTNALSKRKQYSEKYCRHSQFANLVWFKVFAHVSVLSIFNTTHALFMQINNISN